MLARGGGAQGPLLQTVNSKLVYSRDNRIVKDTLREYGKKDSEILDLIYNQDAFGQCDADYASVKEPSLKSTTGYCFFAWHNLICWKSKLQPILPRALRWRRQVAVAPPTAHGDCSGEYETKRPTRRPVT